MITAPLVIAIIAFVIGMLFLFHYIFDFEEKTEHTKKD
jgi:heme/copper-type cytochrome/quinol oxidase subunit 2